MSDVKEKLYNHLVNFVMTHRSYSESNLSYLETLVNKIRDLEVQQNRKIAKTRISKP